MIVVPWSQIRFDDHDSMGGTSSRIYLVRSAHEFDGLSSELKADPTAKIPIQTDVKVRDTNRCLRL